MNDLETLLGMIATEAAESAEDIARETRTVKRVKQVMDFPLELVRKPDGTLLWVE